MLTCTNVDMWTKIDYMVAMKVSEGRGEDTGGPGERSERRARRGI